MGMGVGLQLIASELEQTSGAGASSAELCKCHIHK